MAEVMNVNPTQDLILEAVRQRAEKEARYLAGEFVRAAAKEKEAILTALHFEQWLATSSEACLQRPREPS